MRLLLVMFLAGNLMAMAPKRPTIPDTGTPSSPSTPPASISPVEARFKELAQLYGTQLPNNSIAYSFRSFFGSTIGMCVFSGSKRSVQLSSSAWNNSSDTFKEMLLFHELGHCLLNRDHKNTRHSDGRPESLMASSLFSQSVYLAHRDEYLKELFTAETAQFVQMVSRAKSYEGCGVFKSKPLWEE